MRTFVMGDVHGGYKSLIQCLERSNFDYERDHLIQLGDLVDSGRPDWILVMRELKKISRLTLIRGNHDQWIVDYLQTKIPSMVWLENGGVTTYNVYLDGIQSGLITEREVVEFFDRQIPYFVDNSNRLFVHGGFSDPRGVQYDRPLNLYWDRSLFDHSMNGRSDESHLRSLYSEIFIGHTSTNSRPYITDQPINVFNIWNVDTGGGGYGRLTIMDVDTKEFWQSDKMLELYPDMIAR